MAKLKYTRDELLALKDANTSRPQGMPDIPGITTTFSQTPLVKTTFKPVPQPSSNTSVAATDESKSESTNSFNIRIS